MSDQSEALATFVHSLTNRNVGEALKHIDPQFTYESPTRHGVCGPQAIRVVMESWIAPTDRLDWHITKLEQQGPTIETERIEKFYINGAVVQLPVKATFTFRENKIQNWRDEFDPAQWDKQFAQSGRHAPPRR